jgi:hypothetical protein
LNERIVHRRPAGAQTFSVARGPLLPFPPTLIVGLALFPAFVSGQRALFTTFYL